MSAPIPEEVRHIHENADTDGSARAIHHTLGPGRDQAASGAHVHDGGDSKLILEGSSITGSRSGGTALTSVIALLVQMGATDATTS
jgi:hypothetical protein